MSEWIFMLAHSNVYVEMLNSRSLSLKEKKSKFFKRCKGKVYIGEGSTHGACRLVKSSHFSWSWFSGFSSCPRPRASVQKEPWGCLLYFSAEELNDSFPQGLGWGCRRGDGRWMTAALQLSAHPRGRNIDTGTSTSNIRTDVVIIQPFVQQALIEHFLYAKLSSRLEGYGVKKSWHNLALSEFWVYWRRRVLNKYKNKCKIATEIDVLKSIFRVLREWLIGWLGIKVQKV